MCTLYPENKDFGKPTWEEDVKMQGCLLWWTLLMVVQIFPPSRCFNHWVVTEDGKIEHQVQMGVCLVC